MTPMRLYLNLAPSRTLTKKLTRALEENKNSKVVFKIRYQQESNKIDKKQAA
jgi:hypothetical protein